jgi:peptidoglycan/xylan/chitin deacetylase (PgdA/CDA1 family)
MPLNVTTARRDAVRSLAGSLPTPWWRRMAGVSLVLPYYHMVSDSPVPHVSHLYRFRDVAQFKADLEYLSRHYQPLALRDLVAIVGGNGTCRRPSFHLTFDDGFREMYEVVAPILRQKGIPATFFLNSAFLDAGGMAHHNAISVLLDRLTKPLSAAARRRVESQVPGAGVSLKARLLGVPCRQRALVRLVAETLDVDLDAYVKTRRPYMSSGQVRSLASGGFTIGAHSHDHPLYADLALDEQIAQTAMSLQYIASQVRLDQRAFAFPFTGAGVGRDFFDAMCDSGRLDICFGTAGMRSHWHPRTLERVGMEKTAAPAGSILNQQYVRATYHRIGRSLRRAPATGV